MKNNELYNRLNGFLKSEETLEENILQGDNPVDKDFKAVLHQLDVLSRKSYRPDRRRMWENICRGVIVCRRKLLLRRCGMAAAILMPLALVSVLFYNFLFPTDTVQSLPPVMARNQVQLFMNDGRVVQVQQISRDSMLEERGVGIRIDSGRSITYTSENDKNAGLIYHVLRVPRCCEYHLVLSDGTEVWVNSESELRFPVDFTGDERRVFLRGEAYFKVAKNAGQPFRVEAGSMLVEALGTGFDVSAYQEDGKSTATLVSGCVRVSDLGSGQQCILEPGRQAQLQSGVLSSEQVNVDEVTGWKEGRFVFNNMPLEEIVRQLERWYDVRIDFQDVVLKYYRFTGVMKRYNQLSQLMELIEETTDVKFQTEGRNVRICRRQ